MATTVKSAQITNLDATPALATTAGQGAPNILKSVNGFVTSVVTSGASQAASYIYRMCRIPATAKVKAVYFEGAAQTTGTWDIGLYYSSATNDGTPAAQQGTLVPGALQFFGSGVSLASQIKRTDVTDENGTYPGNLRNVPIAAATNATTQITSLSTSQLGGFLDVCLTNLSTTQVAGLMHVEVQFTT